MENFATFPQENDYVCNQEQNHRDIVCSWMALIVISDVMMRFNRNKHENKNSPKQLDDISIEKKKVGLCVIDNV